MKPKTGYRYRTAEESREPGYLAKRFKAFERLQRMQDAKSNVQPLEEARAKKASK